MLGGGGVDAKVGGGARAAHGLGLGLGELLLIIMSAGHAVRGRRPPPSHPGGRVHLIIWSRAERFKPACESRGELPSKDLSGCCALHHGGVGEPSAVERALGNMP